MNKKNVKINEDAFHELKIYCAKENKKIYEVASMLISEGIKKSQVKSKDKSYE